MDKIKPISWLRRTTVNVSMVVLSLVTFVLMLEGGLRVYSEFVFPKMMVIDEKLGWRHAANVSRTFVNEHGDKVLVIQNALGHRGIHRATQNPSALLRILALGDSFTEAVQVDENDVFTAQLELADSHLEVLNAGVGGYGTVQEYLYLASEGLKLHPDLVLLMFFENDLTDNGTSYYPGFGPRPYAMLSGRDATIVQTPSSREYEKFTLPVPFRMALNNYSYLYYFVNSRIYQRLYRTQMLQQQQQDLRKLAVDVRYKLFYSLLEQMRGLLAEREIPLLVVLIPSREDVARGSSESSAIITEHCTRRNINCLPLIDRFKSEASKGLPLYFEVDMHWTKEGHKKAADEILKYVRSARPFKGNIAAKTAR